tara:strand:- start:1139 stop:1492 length:354 start_codon:yes stop_codon:yes gene_type:complete
MSNIENYSLSRQLLKEGKINKDFEQTISKLSLQEIIALKLDISARNFKGKFYGANLYYTLPAIAREAAVQYAMSVCKTKVAASLLLGVPRTTLKKLLRSNMKHLYFICENNRRVDLS